MTNNEGLKANLIGWLKLIYTDIAAGELISVAEIIEKRVKRNSSFSKNIPKEKWSEKSCLLISYGDSVSGHSRAPIGTLNNFTQENMEGLISCIHILPFFPSSSDDGFAVIDYYNVDNNYGDWGNINKISKKLDPNSDLKLKETLGHTKFEVIIGSVLGPLITLPGIFFIGSPLDIFNLIPSIFNFGSKYDPQSQVAIAT